MSEMYVMQRFLQPNILKKMGLHYFDSWAATFGEVISSLEITPEGSGYRIKNRFAKFHNLPELMNMFKLIADIQTSDMLDLPVPKIKGGKAEVCVSECSEFQKLIMQSFVERAELIRKREVDPTVDNMLKLTNEAKLMAIDPRLVYEDAPNDPDSKLNSCIRNVHSIWENTAENKLTQVIFCDSGTPKPGQFNVYDETKEQLMQMGVPENEIAFIHDAKTDAQRDEMFEKMRKGQIRILLGSTSKLGTGTNIQTKLIALHHLDVPWRPSDLSQRAGRIVRQGNKNAEVQIFRYATSGTFDSYLWQTVEAKQKFIAQIMSSKSPVRSCEDVDETALSYAEIKALCAGNPLIAEKMNLDVEVAKLRMLKADHQSLRFRLEDDLLKRYPEQITAVKERISGIEKDIETYTLQKTKLTDVQGGLNGAVSVSAKFPGMIINGVEYKEKEPAAKALLEACKNVTNRKDKAVGSYLGFDMSLHFESFGSTFNVLLRGKMTYQSELGTDAFGNITRINHTLADLPKRLEGAKTQLETLYSQQEAARQEIEKPFALTDELAEKESRLILLNTELNIDESSGIENGDKNNLTDDTHITGYVPENEQRASSAKSVKPSLLEDIHSFNPEKKPLIPGKKISERDI